MKISTSILSAKDRVSAVTKLNRTNTSYIHVDVMDGKFVQDTQFNKINEVNSINLVSRYPMDIHLMVNNPYEYVIQYKNMNIEFITFHIESYGDKQRVIDEIKNMGYKVGMAIKPDTDIKKLNRYLDKIDMILVMSVEPGKGGQEFIHSTVDKINSIKELIGDRNILLEVDGGINDKTISLVQMVDIVVSGSYVVKSDNYYKSIESLVPSKKVEKKEEKGSSVQKNNSKFGNIFDCLAILVIVYISFLILYGVFSIFFGYEGLSFFGNDGNVVFGFSSFFSAVTGGLFYAIAFMIGLFPFSLLILILFVCFIKVIVSITKFSVDRSSLYAVEMALIILIIIIYLISGYF